MSDFTNRPKETPFGKLLMEDGYYLLLEDSGNIVLDQENSIFTNLAKH